MANPILRMVRQAFQIADWFGAARTIARSGNGNTISKPFCAGISIIIPERANPAQLRDCLQSTKISCARVVEPVEVIVVVSGSPESDYQNMIHENASVRWLFSSRPLWFSGAVRIGLEAARYDWVYLLNNDMIMDALALCSLLQWRAPNVFAISSQIYFKDPNKRREETGWTRFNRGAGPMEILDAPPDDETTVRGNLYAGGGASLFQRDLLIELARHSSVYDPFYWEDVEWGTRAWRRGYQVLFCPESKVWHEHRATNRKFFEETEINRIQKRNRLVYHLRNHLGEGSSGSGEFDEIIGLLDRRTLLELLRPDRMVRILGGRIRTCFLPFRDVPLEYTWHKYYLKPPALTPKPLIAVVTPYAVYPPAHGGARRIHGILEALSERFDIVLLSDEIDLYTNTSTKYFAPLASVHLTGGRVETSSNNRIDRIASHSHFVLAEQLRFLLAAYRPAIVQIEHVELSQLAAMRNGTVPWFLTLHDVLLSERGSRSLEDAYETNQISQFDAVITCSEQDARLVPHEHVFIIPNGAAIDTQKRTSSPERAAILFMGPFRYPPNLDGIQEFLQIAYGPLLTRVPGLELWILGGYGAPKIAASLKCFDQPGVRVIDYVERPREWLNRCTLTINPLRGVRGSCVKVIESVAAGRVCVSTSEGARGFTHAGFFSLIVTDTVEDFIKPLERLLLDHEYRRSLESVPQEALIHFSWKHAADLQADLYRQWMNRFPIASHAGF